MRRLGLLAAWLGVVCLAPGAAPSTPAAPQPIARVVCQYALTSANDFPQRDPRDWRLLGSNDGGKTWTTLDIRQGETFAGRHERRLFRIAHPAAFNLYRLQIDRVRDSLAAGSVQLAELEPLGQTEEDVEPVPGLTDVVAVQGENAPWETRFNAFDGQVETKWLDFAAQNPSTRASWIQWQYTNSPSLLITNVEALLRLKARADQRYAVRLEGWVAGRSEATNRWWFLDATGHLQLEEAGPAQALPPGQAVVLEGLSQWSNRQPGLHVTRLTLRGAPAPTAPKPLGLEQPLASAEEYPWVEVEGQVQFCRWAGKCLQFELTDNEQRLAVTLLRAPADSLQTLSGAQVRARGICSAVRDIKGRRMPGMVWLPGLEALTIVRAAETSAEAPPQPGPKPSAPTSLPTLTSVGQVRRLTASALLRHPKVKLRGVVTELFGTFIQDDTGGIEVQPAFEARFEAPPFGMYVEVEGTGDWAEGDVPVVRATQMRALAPGKLPQAERPSWHQLASGAMVDRWIEVEAVVRSTDGSQLLLNCEGEPATATIRSAPAPLVQRLVDATVRLRGVGTVARDERQVQGVHLLVPSMEFVEVEQPAPEPFALPTRPINALLQASGPKAFNHRVKIEGVLTLQQGSKYFLQDATGSALAIAKQDLILSMRAHWVFRQTAETAAAAPDLIELHPGDRVQVAGFPEIRGYSLVLAEALVRKVGEAPPVKPVQADSHSIFEGRLDSTLVSLEAVLLRQQLLGETVVLELRGEHGVFQALLPSSGEGGPAWAPGSRVRVTGVCQLETLPYADFGKSVAAFKLLLANAGAITVLERPPWWNLKRTLAAAGVLGVILVLALAWIAILRRQVDERTRQLKQEIEERKRIEEQVERGHKELLVTSRLAGMAEVATSVLHNVGNVLNSANMVSSWVVNHVRNSRVANVGKLASLLTEHRTELPRFVAEDQRGQHLPEYLERLGRNLTEEQALLLEKVRALADSLQHIKEIVAMQQNYAKISGLSERVAPAEILEDALRLHGGALARSQIQLLRQFQDVPPVTVDRHKVLQILFNLLENARYACEQSLTQPRQITLRIRPKGSGVEIGVADNGIGIAPENLGRIFQQGFSTRKGGHGFGLHSSILAAQDMGATLTAHSEGQGKGAEFTLALPCGG